MQYQTMPFGWSMPLYLPLPPTIDDRDLFINSIVNGGPGTPGPEGPPGADGVSIVSAEVTPNPGNLLLLLSDGSIIDAGQVVGPAGPPGPPGPAGDVCSVKTITADYTAQPDDCYIGCMLEDAATLTLLNNVEPGTRYAIKLEFGAPVGTRKLTVRPELPALINGVTSITLTTPYQSLEVIYNNGNWWTI